MAPRLKQDYAALVEEYDRRVQGESIQDIKADFTSRGIHWRTFQNHRTQAKKTTKGTPMIVDEIPVKVLPGQMSIEDADTPPDQVTSLSAIADMVPMNGEVSERLSPAEVQTLEHYERIIDQGIKTFVEVGLALTTIREERLYRETYTTFETYLRERWNLDRSYAHRMIDAAQVVENLLPIGNILPVNESQTRPLTSLSPAQQVEVWKEVVETAPAGKVTAQHVKDTVKRATATGTTPPKTTGPKPPKPFDVQGITSKIKDLYMDWLKHCETDDALETAQFFLNTLSDLAQGRAMLLHRQ